MSYVNPIWLEGRRRYWQRHDWRLWVKPEAHHLIEPLAAKSRAETAEDQARADAVFLAELEALRADHERVRIELADVKFALALRRIFHKYSADQPRDDRGRWTDGGDSGQSPRPQLTQIIRVCMAGSSAISTDRWGNQKYWVEYTCADGFTFRNYGLGGKFPAFVVDTRR